MTKVYVGFRIEVSNNLVCIKNLIKKYNSSHNNTKIFDICSDSKITVEKKGNMVIARGIKADFETGISTFSAVTEIGDDISDGERLVKIMNILGNDRLIKEKTTTFIDNGSNLNNIPELTPLKDAFIDLDSIIPGFLKSSWYYAPDMVIK